MVMNKQFKIAACFALLTVLVWGVSVDACKLEDEACDASNPCCEGLVCLEVSPGVFKCEPEGCEDHEGHSCDPNDRPCCEPLVCHEVSPGVFQCESEGCEEHVGHSCSLEEPIRECCEPLECSSTCNTCYNPNCTLALGDTCDPNGSACCEHRGECQEVSPGVFKCGCADVCSDENDCCEGYVCFSGDCVCKLKEGDECNPDACVDECCDLDCVAVAPNTYECHAAA